MRNYGYFFVASVACFQPVTAAGQVLKFECVAEKTKVIRLVEVDAKGKAKHWAKFADGQTNGPFGPHEAQVSQDQIVWHEATTRGSSSSKSTYTLKRNAPASLKIRIEYSYQDPWEQTSPCKQN